MVWQNSLETGLHGFVPPYVFNKCYGGKSHFYSEVNFSRVARNWEHEAFSSFFEQLYFVTPGLKGFYSTLTPIGPNYFP